MSEPTQSPLPAPSTAVEAVLPAPPNTQFDGHATPLPDTSNPNHSRRRWVVAGAACVAAVAGASLAVWRSRHTAEPPDFGGQSKLQGFGSVTGKVGQFASGASDSDAAFAADAEAAGQRAFWASQMQTPRGADIAMASFRDAPLLVNFWATWCPPCIEELPMLDRFYRERRNPQWQLLGVAIDKPLAVQNFLRKLPLTFAVGIAESQGIELCMGLGNPGGGLPYSVMFDSRGKLQHRRIGKVTPADLQAWGDLV